MSSTASAPGELEFSDWLARMEETRAARSSSSHASSAKDRKVLPRGSSRDSQQFDIGADKEERKKKRRSWVNLLVR